MFKMNEIVLSFLIQNNIKKEEIENDIYNPNDL